MIACTFFGHRDCPAALRPALYNAVLDLIEQKGVNHFYVGNQGAFDSLVYSVLAEIKEAHPQVHFDVVLAYLPAEGTDNRLSHSLFPQGIESVPKRFCIPWRNRWMTDRSDYAIVYVARPWGGAAKAADDARRKGKTVINLFADT